MINGYYVCLEMIEQVVFDDVSFVFDHNQRVGLVGRNGSGKSTLLKAIAGKQPLDSGSMLFKRVKPLRKVVLENDTAFLFLFITFICLL